MSSSKPWPGCRVWAARVASATAAAWKGRRCRGRRGAASRSHHAASLPEALERDKGAGRMNLTSPALAQVLAVGRSHRNTEVVEQSPEGRPRGSRVEQRPRRLAAGESGEPGPGLGVAPGLEPVVLGKDQWAECRCLVWMQGNRCAHRRALDGRAHESLVGKACAGLTPQNTRSTGHFRRASSPSQREGPRARPSVWALLPERSRARDHSRRALR